MLFLFRLLQAPSETVPNRFSQIKYTTGYLYLASNLWLFYVLRDPIRLNPTPRSTTPMAASFP